MSGHFELLDHDLESVRMHRGEGTIFIPNSPINLQLQEQESEKEAISKQAPFHLPYSPEISHSFVAFYL